MGIQDGQRCKNCLRIVLRDQLYRAMDPNSNLYYSEEGVGLLPHREEDESWSHGVVEGAGEGQGNVSKASGKESEKHASGNFRLLLLNQQFFLASFLTFCFPLCRFTQSSQERYRSHPRRFSEVYYLILTRSKLSLRFQNPFSSFCFDGWSAP